MIPPLFWAHHSFTSERIMRTVVALAIGLAIFGGRSASAVEEQGAAAGPAKRSYAVQCRVLGQGHGRDSIKFMAPKLGVNDGEKGVLQDITERPFVTAVRTVGKVQTPVIQVVREGTTIEVTVNGTGENEVLVDVSVDFADTARPEVKKDGRGNDYQAVHQGGFRGRAIENVTLGQKTVMHLSDNKNLPKLDVEITVTAAPEKGDVAAR
jgi:hypothetical protein